MEIDVLGIVEKWLVDNGFDGLYEPEGECACRLSETGIAPCGQIGHDCRPGHLIVPCPTPDNCGKSCEWHIGDSTDKPA